MQNPSYTLFMPPLFGKAPLVELIVELRWNPFGAALGLPPQAGLSPSIQASGSPSPEGFFRRFADQADRIGFRRSERIVPDGFPMFLHQPVFRYRKTDPEAAELLQVGQGLFSVNAIPPYNSWDTFEPVVRNGIEALLASRSDEERMAPFTMASVRYIDAFGPDLMAGWTTGSFMSEVLGFKVELPSIVSALIPEGQAANAFLHLNVPTQGSLMTEINIGEGLSAGSKALIVQTAVCSMTPVLPALDDVMTVLNGAHGHIRKMFLEMTRKIHDRIGLEGQGEA